MTEGAGVVLSRADVHYVVTEYGIADLFGKNIRERVLALAEVAHPDYRNEILHAAKNRRYILQHQKELPKGGAAYPREYETTRVLNDGPRFSSVRSSQATIKRCVICFTHFQKNQ